VSEPVEPVAAVLPVPTVLPEPVAVPEVAVLVPLPVALELAPPPPVVRPPESPVSEHAAPMTRATGTHHPNLRRSEVEFVLDMVGNLVARAKTVQWFHEQHCLFASRKLDLRDPNWPVQGECGSARSSAGK